MHHPQKPHRHYYFLCSHDHQKKRLHVPRLNEKMHLISSNLRCWQQLQLHGQQHLVQSQQRCTVQQLMEPM
jgi:hypothetical protein